MTGELIQSANTYNEGRVAINEAFSGEVSFNAFSANTIYSGGTNLYEIFGTGSGGGEFTAGTGIYSIVAVNDSVNMAGDYSMVTGYANSGQSMYSFIGGGSHNLLYPNNHYSAILAGSGNTIQNAPPTTGHTFGLILGGHDNLIEKGNESSFILSSKDSIIREASSFSSIIGGLGDDEIGFNSYLSTIINGGSSKISGSTNSTLIGSSGEIYDTYNSFLIGGGRIENSSYSFAAPGTSIITGGTYNFSHGGRIYGSEYSFAKGEVALVEGADYAFAFGGYVAAYGDHSRAWGGGFGANYLIASGISSINFSRLTSSGNVGAVGDYSSIIGGVNNQILFKADESSILGGDSHTIGETSYRSAIIGGRGVTIDGGGTTDSIIVLGCSTFTATESYTTYVENLYSRANISATTFYSGSTELSTLFGGGGTPAVDPFSELVYFSAGNVFWDASSTKNKILTLTANTTLQVAGTSNGEFGTLNVIQDGTGGWALSLSGTNKVANGGGGVITVTSSPNAEDVLSFADINGTKYWNTGVNYS